jgi:hypothetical protein
MLLPQRLSTAAFHRYTLHAALAALPALPALAALPAQVGMTAIAHAQIEWLNDKA